MYIYTRLYRKITSQSRAYCAEVEHEWACSIQYFTSGGMRYHTHSLVMVGWTHSIMSKPALFNCFFFSFFLFFFFNLRKIRIGAMWNCSSTKAKKLQLFLREITSMGHHCLKKNRITSLPNILNLLIYFSVFDFCCTAFNRQKDTYYHQGKLIHFLNEAFEINRG